MDAPGDPPARGRPDRASAENRGRAPDGLRRVRAPDGLRRVRVALIAASAVLAALLVALVALRGLQPRAQQSAASEPAPLAMGTAIEKPRTIPQVRLIDEDGRPVTVPGAWRGMWVVLAPFDSACTETCPMTTGALMQLDSEVRAAGLAGQVVIAEVSLDPWKDTPARLRAYRKLTGTPVQLLTGTAAQLHRLWSVLGVYYKRVPESNPPAIDWYTGKPSTSNVEHADNVFFLDPVGHERIANEGMANVEGHLEPALRRMLNRNGLRNLADPQLPWTAAQALDDLYWLLGRNVTPAAVPVVAPPSPAQARSALAGAPAALAALHAQADQVLGPESALVRRLRSLRGYPVVLNAWASWCPPCRAELPLFAVASAHFGKRVAFLGADVEDTSRAARAFLAKHPVSYPSYASSSQTLDTIAPIVGIPTTFYISATGKVLATHPGQYGSEAALSNDIERYALGR
jgi:cytochrome c biogenesis protein CcmG/thiol:disulfide interchange protein DsbE